MAQPRPYLERLKQSSGQLSAVQEDVDMVSGSTTSQAMLPPPPRHTGVKPPAGKKTLQQQAMLAAAAQSSAVGTLGTIPDKVPLDTAGEPASSTNGQAIPEFSLSKWDQYFDSIADLQMEDRHGVFRWTTKYQ
ncbi:TPA: hypothetical protein ACH3X1_011415 [Trebouxia sp. C0004]